MARGDSLAVRWACALGLMALACAGVQTHAQTLPAPAPHVTLAQGVARGVMDGDVEIYRGLPYAKPPVGALRWKPPQKPERWAGERYAVGFAPPCSQPTDPDGRTANGGGVAGATSEDCLYLNVWAPKNAKLAPVIVWLHGGAGYLGAGNLGAYHGLENARAGVVTVTLNYRLGALGNFSYPALTKEAGKSGWLSAYGLMDAVEALTWIKTNARAFGGDPDNITLAGQSAGGAMVVNLLSTRAARGLFDKAIIESGAILRPGVPLAEAEASAKLAVLQLGLDEDASLAQLRAVSAGTLVANPATQRGFGAPLDGRFRTQATQDALVARNDADVPLLIGSNAGEPGFEAARKLAKAAAHGRGRTWLYRFDYVPAWRVAEQPNGPPHSAEIPYAFNSLASSATGGGDKVTDADRAVAKRINSCWLAFARMPPRTDPTTDSFTCAEGFAWPAWSETGDAVALLGQTLTLGKAASLPDGPPRTAN